MASNPTNFIIESKFKTIRLQKSNKWIIIAPSALISSSACWRLASLEETSVESSWKIDSWRVEAWAGAAATAVARTELVARVISSVLSIEVLDVRVGGKLRRVGRLLRWPASVPVPTQ